MSHFAFATRRLILKSKLARLKTLLKSATRHITLKRFAIAFFGLPFAFYIYREVTYDALVIDPITVPKQFEESGLTPDVMANRVGNAMRQIETGARTRLRKDNLSSLYDERSTPDVEIPGTRLGLRTVVDVTRAVFGVYAKHVGGDIVSLRAGSSGSSPPTCPQVKVTIYITHGKERSQSVSLNTDATDVDSLSQKTAEMILGQVNPYILAVIRYDQHRIDDVANLLNRMVANPSEDKEHLSAAIDLLGNLAADRENYDEAVAKYAEAIRLNPKSSLPYVNWGRVLQNQQKYDEAISKYQMAIELDPKYAVAYDDWGFALQNQQKYDEAISKYQKAIELDPKYAYAYNNWGVVLENQQKYDEAVSKYQMAIELDPKFAYAYNNWGIVLQNQQKYDEAISKYQMAIELDPKFAWPYNNWGIVLQNQQKYDEAISKYQKAIELDPKYAHAYRNWGRALEFEDKHAEAEEKFAKARQLSR